MRIEWKLGLGILAVCSLGWAQPPQPDAQSTREELSRLLERYPPSVRNVLGVDPGLLGNQPYLATYPALASYLNNHPEIAHNPSFYIPAPAPVAIRDNAVAGAWKDVVGDLMIVLNFGMAVGLGGWL